MARRLEVTNRTPGPKGFHEVEKSAPTVIARGETRELVVDEGTADLIHREAERRGDAFTVVDLGEVKGKDGGLAKKDSQGAVAGTTKPAANEKPNHNPAPPPPGGQGGEGGGSGGDAYTPSLDFETMEEEPLRAFLKSQDVAFHPATGLTKLRAKALEADRAAWDEAQKEKAKAAAAGGAQGGEAI